VSESCNVAPATVLLVFAQRFIALGITGGAVK
jgi:ABC-type maltose transport system permease subunit